MESSVSAESVSRPSDSYQLHSLDRAVAVLGDAG